MIRYYQAYTSANQILAKQAVDFALLNYRPGQNSLMQLVLQITGPNHMAADCAMKELIHRFILSRNNVKEN